MNLLVTGAGGLIGSSMCERARERGWRVVRLRRTAGPGGSGGPDRGEPVWDVRTGRVDLASAGPIDAVVHLAGETIMQRWTVAARRRIRQSRVDGTAALVAALSERTPPPRVLVSASAIGFYGDRGDAWVDEQSERGTGFLADVCQEWEAAAQPLSRVARVVSLRLGVVLSHRGGALAKMLPAFRWGVGGRIGSGRQYLSWILLDDVLRIIERVIDDASLWGPINVVAPGAVTNAEFTRVLGRRLKRPTFMSVPGWAVRLALGQMGREVLLGGVRVRPVRLLDAGFQFSGADLERALEKEIGGRNDETKR
jgi:uncharacterized protein (TIGR01777 family)